MQMRCQNATVVITNWFTVTKYIFYKWQWIFYFLRRFLLPLSQTRTSPELTMSKTVDVLSESGTLTFSRTRRFTPGVHTRIFGSWVIFLVLFVVLLFSLSSFCVLCLMFLFSSLECLLLIAPHHPQLLRFSRFPAN
jgi:hypothetical protein